MIAKQIMYKELFCHTIQIAGEITGKSFDYPENMNPPGDLIIMLLSLKIDYN